MAAPRRRKEKAEPSFEDSLEELQTVVAKLEEGDLPLLESIETYRQGIEVLKRCRGLLEEARATVEVLSAEAQSELGEGDADGADEEDDDEGYGA